ncbi:MAG: response regulator transcription factor [Bacteroidetes bacterium]|nr:response regulator transcription factor [Bacteroidota bacterium]
MSAINVALVEADKELNSICFSVLNNAHAIEVTERFYNFYSFQKSLPDIKSSIVVLDITLPGINILNLISTSKKQRPDINIIISSAWVQHDWVYQCLCAGASGYVNKYSNARQLINIITEISAGQAQLSLPVAQLIHSKCSIQSHSNFTPLQSQIIKLFAAGHSHAHVGNVLDKTIFEVQLQIGTIYNTLHQSSVSA